MAFFKVKPYCEFRVMIEGTTSCRSVFPSGSVVELENINEGEQASRLEPLCEKETEQLLIEREAKRTDMERIATESINAGKPPVEDKESKFATALGNEKLERAKRLLGGAIK